MIKTVKVGQLQYDVSTLSEEGQYHLSCYQHAAGRLKEAENLLAVLNKARRAYIADIKSEIIQGNTGIDLSTLFND
jgi:hypothetical protein